MPPECVASASAAPTSRTCTGNFLINDKGATGEDIERLGETVRARIKASSGIAEMQQISSVVRDLRLG